MVSASGEISSIPGPPSVMMIGLDASPQAGGFAGEGLGGGELFVGGLVNTYSASESDSSSINYIQYIHKITASYFNRC